MDGKKRNVVWLLSAFVITAALGVAGLKLVDNGAGPAPIVIEPPPPSTTPGPTATAQPLRVYITGAILRPDVYSLPAGSIVRDLVDAAGDFTAQAATEAVNLAQPLADGMHVHVPAQEDASGEPPVISGPAPPANSFTGGATLPGALVNINTASIAELETLPDIGPSLAQRIVDHRAERGPFATIEAIQDVSGIGPAIFEQIRAWITTQ
jgi:competence protein ComEA